MAMGVDEHAAIIAAHSAAALLHHIFGSVPGILIAISTPDARRHARIFFVRRSQAREKSYSNHTLSQLLATTLSKGTPIGQT
jgi:hypothetical protein